MQQQSRALLSAAGAILLWSTVATAFKLGLQRMDPPALLLYSSLVSTLALATLTAVTGAWRRHAGRWRELIAASLLSGALNPFLYYLVLFEAYDRLPAQEAQPLNYTWPIVLSVLSAVVLGQKLRLPSIAALAVSFLGVAVISTRGDLLAVRFADPAGVGLAVGSSLIWASYWILSMKDRTDPTLRLTLNFASGSLYILVFTLISGRAVLPDAQGFAAAAWVGLFEMGLTFALWNRALRLSTSTAVVSNLVYLAPFLSLFLIALVLGERILPSTIAGLVLIIGGILLQQVLSRERQVGR